jgi:hypothetical protein
VAAFGGVEKFQNGSRCHGNQDAKNVKFTPNSGSKSEDFCILAAILDSKWSP